MTFCHHCAKNNITKSFGNNDNLISRQNKLQNRFDKIWENEKKGKALSNELASLSWGMKTNDEAIQFLDDIAGDLSDLSDKIDTLEENIMSKLKELIQEIRHKPPNGREFVKAKRSFEKTSGSLENEIN